MGPCVAGCTAVLHPTGVGSSGAGTRTPNNCSRGSCVADYTTPERAKRQVSGLPGGGDPGTRSPAAGPPHLGVEVDQAVVADDPPDTDGQRLVHEVAEGHDVGRIGGRAGVALQTDLAGDVLDP